MGSLHCLEPACGNALRATQGGLTRQEGIWTSAIPRYHAYRRCGIYRYAYRPTPPTYALLIPACGCIPTAFPLLYRWTDAFAAYALRARHTAMRHYPLYRAEALPFTRTHLAVAVPLPAPLPIPAFVPVVAGPIPAHFTLGSALPFFLLPFSTCVYPVNISLNLYLFPSPGVPLLPMGSSHFGATYLLGFHRMCLRYLFGWLQRLPPFVAYVLYRYTFLPLLCTRLRVSLFIRTIFIHCYFGLKGLSLWIRISAEPLPL